MAEFSPVPAWPWAQQSYVLGNLAIGNARENLKKWVTIDGRIHADSLLSVVGALTGYAAQHAALLRAEAATREAGPVLRSEIALAKLASGQEFLMGGWIDLYLVPEQGNKFSLFGFVAGAALQAGLQEEELPNCEDIARRVVASLGTPEFDMVRVSKGVEPRLSPTASLRRFWGPITDVLQLPAPARAADGESPLSPTHWPIILSVVAAQFVGLTKGVISPKISSALVMEAAWIASKVHPETIQPGVWRTTAADGKLSVTRRMTA